MADFRTMKDKIFEALSEYDYELARGDDKTRELADTCAKLAAEKAELEEKIKELTAVIEKLTACCPPKESEKQVLHG